MAIRSVNELREEMLAVARGERKAAPSPPVTTLFSVLTDEALTLLQVLATTPSLTVSALAKHLGQAQSNVSRSLQRLQIFGLVRLVRVGREVHPEIISTDITITVNLTCKRIQVTGSDGTTQRPATN